MPVATKKPHSLAWLWRLEHRRIPAKDRADGLVFYHLPTEHLGRVFNRYGLLPIVELRKGITVHKPRILKSATGNDYRMWDLITMTPDEALGLARAIHEMLGVQPDRQTKVTAPETLSEESETEMLLKKFVGA